jgi:hypothetical protein
MAIQSPSLMTGAGGARHRDATEGTLQHAPVSEALSAQHQNNMIASSRVGTKRGVLLQK